MEEMKLNCSYCQLEGPLAYIPMGLWKNGSNGTRFINLVKTSPKDKEGTTWEGRQRSGVFIGQYKQISHGEMKKKKEKSPSLPQHFINVIPRL